MSSVVAIEHFNKHAIPGALLERLSAFRPVAAGNIANVRCYVPVTQSETPLASCYLACRLHAQAAMEASDWQNRLARDIRAAERGLGPTSPRGTNDPEVVHRIRVAARRLLEYCRIGEQRGLATDLRWLVHQMGELRDLDVIRGAAQNPDEEDWLRDEHMSARGRASLVLRSTRVRLLLKALAELPAIRTKLAEKRLRRLERRVRMRSRSLRRVGDVHALRRAVRHLRYCCEWNSLDAADLELAQESLGRVIDMSIAIEHRERLLSSGSYAKHALRDVERLRKQMRRELRNVRHGFERRKWPAHCTRTHCGGLTKQGASNVSGTASLDSQVR